MVHSIKHLTRQVFSTLVALFSLALLATAGSPVVAQEGGEEQVEYAAEKPRASKSLLLDGTVVDSLMAVVGERGHILTSRDQGVSWQQARVPTRRALTAIFFRDENLGWAVGHDAVILRTSDGGATWERLNFAPEEQRPFLDVWFADDNNGFAIGAYGFFYRTEDGGDTWTDAGLQLTEEETTAAEAASEDDYGYDDYGYDVSADLHLNQVMESSSGRLYIAAEAGTVYRSDDEGETWTSLPSPYEGSFFGTLPLDGDSLLLFGLRGHLFRSDDAGESWQELDTGTQALLTDGLLLEDGTVVVAGLAGALLVSTDGGRSFALKQQADRQGLVSVIPADDGHLVTIGEFGVNRLPIATLLGDSTH